jgi:hypothetical protein
LGAYITDCMASLRAIWLINVAKDCEPLAVLSRYNWPSINFHFNQEIRSDQSFLFVAHRRFPTVENRVRLSHVEGGYMPPPPDSELVRLFVNALAARASPTKQVLVLTKKAPPTSATSNSSSPSTPPPTLFLSPLVFISRRKVRGCRLLTRHMCMHASAEQDSLPVSHPGEPWSMISGRWVKALFRGPA